MNTLFIEAESFRDHGGWVVDTQSMETLHSAYLMAHGMGVPVADAVTEFILDTAGEYTLWALTRDWTAVWDVREPAGRFTIRVDGVDLPATLGTNGPVWGWQVAGTLSLSAGVHILALHDLTGFNGRCDAVYITAAGDAPDSDITALDAMRQRLNWKDIKDTDKVYDLVVVGGGIAGLCTALTALRSGVSVALINDRPVLGGCNSSEVRVCMGGMTHLPPYPRLGDVVREIAPVMGTPSTYREEYFEDARKLFAFEVPEGQKAPYDLYLNQSVTAVEREGDTVTAVVATDTHTGHKTRIRGRLFSDCSGDGVVARRMGCETMYGRESRDRFGESLAPTRHQSLVMGHSIRWYSEETAQPVPFPDIDWNLPLNDDTCLDCVCGDWEQETGFTRNMVGEIEYIRDYGLRAIYANWAYQKHHFRDKARFANRALRWVSPIGGKREGYRVVGDWILTQQDLEEKIPFDDATACITWSIDMHFPEPTNQSRFGEAFRSCAYHRGIMEPYPIPYRCLYARDAANLFIGGRLVSASHVAFSAIRVMRTLGQLGEVVGLASVICKKYGCTPRQVYTDHLDELKALLTRGVFVPDAFDGGVCTTESYHFKDIGWWWLDTAYSQHPEALEKFEQSVAALGLTHKNPLPEKWHN